MAVAKGGPSRRGHVDGSIRKVNDVGNQSGDMVDLEDPLELISILDQDAAVYDGGSFFAPALFTASDSDGDDEDVVD